MNDPSVPLMLAKALFFIVGSVVAGMWFYALTHHRCAMCGARLGRSDWRPNGTARICRDVQRCSDAQTTTRRAA